MAKSLLVNPENWHQKDDRKCEPDIENNHWSLFCALKFASIETTGEYNHHNTAIQTARFVIDDLIMDTVVVLNKKGYTTTYSCSGHMCDNGNEYKPIIIDL